MAEYIDRQDLIKFLENIQQPKMPITQGFKYITIDECIRVIKEKPPVDVAPVIHAKWEDEQCSNCHCDMPAFIIDWKWQKDMNATYCPNCGAKMDK